MSKRPRCGLPPIRRHRRSFHGHRDAAIIAKKLIHCNIFISFFWRMRIQIHFSHQIVALLAAISFEMFEKNVSK